MTKLKNKSKVQKFRDNFENNILGLLEGMGEVIITKAKDMSYLLKDDLIFGKIIDSNVYLMAADSNEYKVVDDQILGNKDAFLMQATKSYFYSKKYQEEFAA